MQIWELKSNDDGSNEDIGRDNDINWVDDANWPSILFTVANSHYQPF